jgi:hypothetical protein
MVNIFAFIFRLIISRSLDKTLRYFGKDYTINCFLTTIHVVADREVQQIILKSSPKLSHLNSIFNSAHGFKYTINNVNDTDFLWHIIHNSIKQSLLDLKDKININMLVDQTIKNNIRPNQLTEMSEFVDQTTAQWFGTIMIGDWELFLRLHAKVSEMIIRTFHSNYFQKIPIIGNIVSIWKRYFAGNEIRLLRKEIHQLINQSDHTETFFKYFHTNLANMCRNDYKKLADEIFIDNMIFAFLTYDFINVVLKGIVFERIDKKNFERNDLTAIMKNNFLFPFRGRVIDQPINIANNSFKKGDICLLNLVESELLFSFGRRSCPGQIIVRPILNQFINTINEIDFDVPDKPSVIKRNPDHDRPFILSKVYCRMKMKQS